MSIASELQRIVEAKTAIIQAITDKGVDVPEGVKVEDLAALIAEIGDSGQTEEIGGKTYKVVEIKE